MPRLRVVILTFALGPPERGPRRSCARAGALGADAVTARNLIIQCQETGENFSAVAYGNGLQARILAYKGGGILAVVGVSREEYARLARLFDIPLSGEDSQ